MALVAIKSKEDRLKASAEKAKTKPQVNAFEIEETNEYDVFERLPGNRPVDEQHVLKLMKAMKKKDLYTPIQINQAFEVVDGQHRLEARKRLGLMVPFFVTPDYGLEEVQELNAKQKKWTNDDFVKSFIELGKKDYLTYQWFRKTYNLPHAQSVEILTDAKDTHSMRMAFQSGEFRVYDLARAKQIGKMLTDIQPYFDAWNHSRFVQAMLIMFRKKAFDYKRFMGKLKSFPAILKPQVSLDAYLQHIEEVYNYKVRDKVALRYTEDK